MTIFPRFLKLKCTKLKMRSEHFYQKQKERFLKIFKIKKMQKMQKF